MLPCRVLLLLSVLVRSLAAFLRSRRDVALENVVLRHQLQVALRTNPTQLLESVIAAALALTGWLLYMHLQIAIPGSLFVGSFAAYTLCRQFLLRLRVEPRKSSIGGPLTAEMAALVLFADVAWWISAAH